MQMYEKETCNHDFGCFYSKINYKIIRKNHLFSSDAYNNEIKLQNNKSVCCSQISDFQPGCLGAAKYLHYLERVPRN